MAYEFKMIKMVEFAETDLAGMLHFSNFFRYMEMTEHAFYRSLNLSVLPPGDQAYGWPRVQASCDFKHPVRFEEKVEIHLAVERISEKSITYLFAFHKISEPAVKNIASGRVTAVPVAENTDSRKIGAIPIPAEFSDKIEEAPKELLENFN